MNDAALKPLPVHRIIKGAIEVAVWANETETSVHFAATLQRSYRIADGSWRATRSLDRDSLLIASEALREASQWIYAEEQRRRAKDHSSQRLEPASTDSDDSGNSPEATC